jgi:hypothetical protein
MNISERSILSLELSHANRVAPLTAWHNHNYNLNGTRNFRDMSSLYGVQSTGATTGNIMLKVCGHVLAYVNTNQQ